jgi:poly(ribitol-phosphate) beta-N-acetylglucosaminyltransferase
MSLLISIVIPTYNAMETVTRCLNSIVNQDNSTLEVIVVDDASNDQTLNVIRDYFLSLPVALQSRYSCIPSLQNSGPGIARNLGVQEAKGQWILFLDADDVLHPKALSNIEAQFNRQTDDVDVVAFDWAYITPQDSALEGMRRELTTETFESKETLLRQYLLNRIDSSVIFHAFRRQAIQQANISFRGGFHEDVDYLFLALLHARKVAWVKEILYYKSNREGSIVNTLGESHLHGYYQALMTMLSAIHQSADAKDLINSFMHGVVNVTASRLMRLLQTSIHKTTDQDTLLNCLWRELFKLIEASGQSLDVYIALRGSLQTKYQKIFALFVSYMTQSVKLSTAEFMSELDSLSHKSWSCYDLQHSVFLAPGEIRTCCKRFYYQKQFKGDVVLLKHEDEPASSLPYSEIVSAKKLLHAEINRDNSSECKGCPFLSFEKWDVPLQSGIQYLSLEYQTVCNMRCTYCSDIYYGGKPAQYQPVDVVQSMLDSNALAACEYIVWGGGEPTLDKTFDEVLSKLAVGVPQVKQRIITNATRFNPVLAQLMQNDRAFIVTSVDAGTEATFEAIRKYYNFNAVMRNLKSYAELAPHNMIIKYILMPENAHLDELKAFCELVKSYELTNCNFQISCDFRTPELTRDQALSLSILYSMLHAFDVRFVFMDDLVWQRLSHLEASTADWITEQLSELHLDAAIVKPQNYDEVVVWGTGEQAKLLMRKTHFLKHSKVGYFVDPRPYKVGKDFLGLPIKSELALTLDQRPILIAAVQSAPFIYQDIERIGIDMRRVIKGLVL